MTACNAASNTAGCTPNPPPSPASVRAAPPRRTLHRRGATSPATRGRRVHIRTRVPPTPGRSRRRPSGWHLRRPRRQDGGRLQRPASARPRRAEKADSKPGSAHENTDTARAADPSGHDDHPYRDRTRGGHTSGAARLSSSTTPAPTSVAGRITNSTKPHRETARRRPMAWSASQACALGDDRPVSATPPRRAARRRRPARRARWLPVPIRRHRPPGRAGEPRSPSLKGIRRYFNNIGCAE